MHSVELQYIHTVDEKVQLNVSDVLFQLTCNQGEQLRP